MLCMFCLYVLWFLLSLVPFCFLYLSLVLVFLHIIQQQFFSVFCNGSSLVMGWQEGAVWIQKADFLLPILYFSFLFSFYIICSFHSILFCIKVIRETKGYRMQGFLYSNSYSLFCSSLAFCGMIFGSFVLYTLWQVGGKQKLGKYRKWVFIPVIHLISHFYSYLFFSLFSLYYIGGLWCGAVGQ